MLIHLLTFSSSNKFSDVTKLEIEMLQQAATKLGHELKIIFSGDCQMKFNGKTGLLIKNHEPKEIKIVLVRANFLTNAEYKSSLIKQFEIAGFPIVNKGIAVRRAKNKISALQILAKDGVPVPKTFIVNNSSYIDNVIDEIGSFPVILKTTTGSHGNGVSIIESKRGLKSIIEMIIKDGNSEPLMVQEYVKESSGKDVRVFVVKNRIIGVMERIATKRGEFRSNFHLGGKVRVASMTEEEKKITFQSVNALGLEIAGVDIIRTKNGPKILEVNANPGLEGITQVTGRDIAGEIIKYTVKKAKRIENKKNKDKKW